MASIMEGITKTANGVPNETKLNMALDQIIGSNRRREKQRQSSTRKTKIDKMRGITTTNNTNKNNQINKTIKSNGQTQRTRQPVRLQQRRNRNLTNINKAAPSEGEQLTISISNSSPVTARPVVQARPRVARPNLQTSPTATNRYRRTVVSHPRQPRNQVTPKQRTTTTSQEMTLNERFSSKPTTTRPIRQ